MDDFVQNAKTKGKSKIVKVNGPSFMIREYTFSSVDEEGVRKYKSKAELLEKYREASKRVFEEWSKLCEEVDKLQGQKTSLAKVRDSTKGTLNLVVIMR